MMIDTVEYNNNNNNPYSQTKDGIVIVDTSKEYLTSTMGYENGMSSKMMTSSGGVLPAPSQQPAIRVKKRTRFALSNNEVFPIPHINDMCDEEVHAIWYEKVDYDKIKQDIIPIVKRVMKGEKIEETNELTIRGLEYRTRKGAIRRQHNKVEAITAVLDEQDRQIELDIFDAELISNVYLDCAAHCLVEAQQLASGDETFARDYYKVKHIIVSRTSSECSITSATSRNDDDCSVTSSKSGARPGAERKASFTKMFKQMRIRRRPSISSKGSSSGSESSSNSYLPPQSRQPPFHPYPHHQTSN